MIENILFVHSTPQILRPMVSSTLVHECRHALEELPISSPSQIVLEHRGVEGNERAYEIAKNGSLTLPSSTEAYLGHVS